MALTPWKTGDPLAAAHLQESVARLSEVEKYINGGSGVAFQGLKNIVGSSIVRIWIMQIVAAGPNGEPDPTGCTYWATKQACINDFVVDGNDHVEINLDDESMTDQNPLTINATNLAEFVAETHTLKTDGSEFVIVFEVQARQNAGTTYPLFKYFFSSGGGAAAVPGQYIGMVYQVVSTNTGGWDWVQAHAELP